jgi:hypothetical protein
LLESDDLALAEIEARLRESRDERVAIDETTLMSLKVAIERASERFRDDPVDLDRLEELAAIVALVRSMQIHVDLRKPQNDYYRMVAAVRPAITDPEWIAQFERLGEALSISAEAAQ